MKEILIGDVGGTKTLLRLVELGADHVAQNIYEQRFASARYGDFKDLLQEFLVNAASQLGHLPAIARACFGIAGPVLHHSSRQTSQLTNLGWHLDSDRLAAELGIPKVSLINDFVAVGYGVLGLQPDDLYTLQIGQRNERSPIAVIGAGTGLGQGFLAWHGDRYEVYGTEGGHTDFAPRNQLEIELLQYLLKRHERVSVERVVSGMGIVAIYQFLRDSQGLIEDPAIAERVRQWESGNIDSEAAAAIANAAMLEPPNQRDRLAVQTMQMFSAAYAAEIGNLALKTLPNGGLYIAGGIAAKILPLLQNQELIGDRSFLQIIKSKGRVSSVLEDLPIHIVLNPEVGLIGAMFYSSFA
jgi:glucokinase